MIQTTISQGLLSRLPFVAAMIVAVAAMGTDVYLFKRRNVGIHKIEPWLSKADKAIRGFAENLVSAFIQALTCREFIAGAALALMLIATGANADPLATGIGFAVAGTTAAEPTLADVKRAIDERNRDFEEIKATVLALKAKGGDDGELKLKLEKIDKRFDELSEANEKFMETRRVVDRLAAAGLNPDGKHADRHEARQKFNLALKARAMESGRSFVEVDEPGFKAYEEGYEKYLRKGDRGLSPEETKAMSVGSDSGGGYVVTPDTNGRIVKRIYETSPISQYASNQTIGTDALEGVFDLDEASFGWVGEQGARTDDNSNPTPDVPWRIPVHEAYCQPKISQKLIDDAVVDIVAWHSAKSGDRISRGFNNAWCVGNGVSKPRGFAAYDTSTTVDGSRAWGSFEHISSGASGAWAADPASVQKLNDVIHMPKDHFLARAAWYMNRTTLGATRKTTDNSSNGKFVFMPSMAAGQPDTILGYAVRRLQDMATYSTAGALAIAFGDMEACYQIVTRLGITVLYDPFTAKPYVRLYTRARVGGAALDFEAMKFVKFA